MMRRSQPGANASASQAAPAPAPAAHLPGVGASPASGQALDQRIAARVAQLRAEAGLSLQALADRSGVSRSMLSLIERGECSATAVVLERVATGLGRMLADLFDAPGALSQPSPLARRAEQAVWQDPGSGYRRRNLSPGGAPPGLQLVEVDFPAGARVAFDSSTRERPVQQQIWLISGELQLTLGEITHALAAGDCLAMRLDQPIVYFNPGRRPARYLVAICPG